MIMRRLSVFFCLLAAAAGSLTAQATRVSGPVSGLVFDEHERAIRPMVGVPGASYLRGSLASGIERAGIAPNSRLALVVIGGHLYLMRGQENGEGWSVLEENTAGTERIVWNRSSTAAAVYSADSRRLRLWRGLQDTPEMSELSLPEGELTATALAVDASAESVVAALQGEQTAVIYVLSRGQAPRRLALLDDVSGLALGNGDLDLYVADRTRQQVLVIRNYREGGGLEMVANEGLGIADPVALTVSDSGKLLLVAGGQSRKVTFLDLATGAVIREIDLDFSPLRLAPLGNDSLYLLNGRRSATDILYVLDAGWNPAVYFVPAEGAEANSVEE